MPSPIASSPLKVAVTEKETILSATDPGGQVVVEGVRGKAAEPVGAVLRTASSTWTISHREGGVRQVTDPAGVVVAEIRGNGWTHDTIHTGDGSEIPCKGRGVKIGYGASFGSLAGARAPFILPKRPFTLTLSDELLARADHEMLVAVFAHIARAKIISAIRSAAAANTPG
jgi:hypothetical protein